MNKWTTKGAGVYYEGKFMFSTETWVVPNPDIFIRDFGESTSERDERTKNVTLTYKTYRDNLAKTMALHLNATDLELNLEAIEDDPTESKSDKYQG